MNIYIIIFLNFILFNLLNYTDLSLFIEKLNYILLFNIVLFYILAIYNKVVLNATFYLHPFSVFILPALILYNYIFDNKEVLVISIFLLALFFILDAKYNSINIKIDAQDNKKYKAYPGQEKPTWQDIKDAKDSEDEAEFIKAQEENRDKERQEKRRRAREKQKSYKEDNFKSDETTNDLMIDIELEEKLVILGLSLGFNMKQLKGAYKKKAKENHPDKFSADKKDVQTIIMKDINNAKSYLEEVLKQAS